MTISISPNLHQLEVGGLAVDVVRKDIKHLHLAVYPPAGRVRVAAPLRLDDTAIRLAVISRLAWIHRHQAAFGDQERQSDRQMVSGESHYVGGRRYRLDVVEHDGPPSVRIRNNRYLELRVRPGADQQKRKDVLADWYRARLRAEIPALLAKWQELIGVTASGWGIRRMKTLWGTCNPETGFLWLNLELAKKPPACTEYLVVHELVHLLERHHNERFLAYLDRFLPQWRLLRDTLNLSPLAHEDWTY